MTDKEWKAAARKAVKYGSIIRMEAASAGQGVCPTEVTTQDFTGGTDLVEIVDVMEELLRTRKPLFASHEVTPSSYRRAVEMTPLGKRFRALFGRSYTLVQDTFPIHQFHPILQLYARHASVLSNFYSTLLPQDVVHINEIVELMRAEGRTEEFRKKRDSHIRWSRESTKTSLRYVSALFAQFSRLLVLRLDVGYRSIAGGCPEISFPIHTAREVGLDRKRLVDHLNKAFRAKPVGYMWALNFGRRKGFHYHLMFFFDGHKFKNAFVLGQEIGNYWSSVVTDGRGTFYNCNRYKYQRHGIGIVHVADTTRSAALRDNAVPYLTKPDYYVRVVVKGAHVFDHGNMPKAARTKRGRPRSKGKGL